MKKILTVLIATLFVFSLGMFAFAEGSNSSSGIDTSSLQDFASVFETITPSSDSSFDFGSLLSGSSGITDLLGGGDIAAVLGDIFSGVDGAALLDTVTQSISSLGLGVADLLGGLSADNMDSVYEGLLDGLNALGVDTGMLTDFLGNSAIFNLFAGLYTAGAVTPETTTEAPTTAEEVITTGADPVVVTIPKTGSPATGVTVFAVLTVAAAAAFVARKKETN